MTIVALTVCIAGLVILLISTVLDLRKQRKETNMWFREVMKADEFIGKHCSTEDTREWYKLWVDVHKHLRPRK